MEKIWFKICLEPKKAPTTNMKITCCGGPFSQLQAGLPPTMLWPNGFGLESRDRLDCNTPQAGLCTN